MAGSVNAVSSTRMYLKLAGRVSRFLCFNWCNAKTARYKLLHDVLKLVTEVQRKTFIVGEDLIVGGGVSIDQ